MCYDAPEMKCYQIFTSKIRWNATGFLSWKFDTNSKHTGKYWSRPHPFWNQTSKPNPVNAPKDNANNSFLIANVLELWFYRNKRLSTDRCCGVPNTFPTCNQTSELKNQDFLSICIRLGKKKKKKRRSHFSLPKIGNKIKKSQVTNHTLEENPMIGGNFTYLW